MFGCAFPSRGKSTSTVLEAFTDIIRNYKRLPKNICLVKVEKKLHSVYTASQSKEHWVSFNFYWTES